MSDKTTTEFQNHVEICGEFKKTTMTFKIKPQLSASIKNFVEVFSTFWWVVMVLWIETGAIALYVLIFVS